MNSGKKANKQGKQLESFVKTILEDNHYQYIPSNKFDLATNSLNQKLYTTELYTCNSIYSSDDYPHKIKNDFVIYNPQKKEKYIIIECKSQTTGGSVDEKFVYLNENIKQKYPYKTILIMDTPRAKKGAVAWLKKQEKNNPNLLHVFQSFSEFRAWATKNLG